MGLSQLAHRPNLGDAHAPKDDPMSKSTLTLTATTVLVGACLVAPEFAAAQSGQISLLQAVGNRERPLMLAASDRGIVLVGADNAVFRAFHHTQSSAAEQPALWIRDIDNDREPEYVGSGNPSFIIDTNGDPMWGVLTGCDEFFVGNYMDDRNEEIVCRRGREFKVWSFDGQPYFEWSGSGFNITQCWTDDYDGDNMMEVGCALSNGRGLRFDLDFQEPEPLESPPEPTTQDGVDRGPSQGRAAGDNIPLTRNRNATVQLAGGSIVLSIEGAQVAAVPIPDSAIYSAAAADLDGDGTSTIYVGGVDRIYVLSEAGELVATLPANPARMTRDARAAVRSATAVNLEDTERDNIRAVVEGNLDGIRQCYAERMGRDQFTRVGQVLYELTVDSRGRVSETTRRHSSLNNRDLESCLDRQFRNLTFSPAAGGTGLVSVTLGFDFVDVP